MMLDRLRTEEQRCRHLTVLQALGHEQRNPRLLRGERLPGRVARVNSLPGAGQLVGGPLRPEREVHRDELAPGGLQLRPSVYPPTSAAQPHAVEQPRACHLEPVRLGLVRRDGTFERQNGDVEVGRHESLASGHHGSHGRIG